jgi:hypothetical protein
MGDVSTVWPRDAVLQQGVGGVFFVIEMFLPRVAGTDGKRGKKGRRTP